MTLTESLSDGYKNMWSSICSQVENASVCQVSSQESLDWEVKGYLTIKAVSNLNKAFITVEISVWGFANLSAILFINFSDNFNKIHQQSCANFSEQLMNKTHFNSDLEFSCYCLNAKSKSFLRIKTKNLSSHSGDQLCTQCLAILWTWKHCLFKLFFKL